MNREELLNHTKPPNGWKDKIANALILSGLGFFGTLTGLVASGLIQNDPAQALIVAGVTAGFQFFASLAIQRGLTK